MALRERLIYAIEVTTDKAQQGLKGFKSAVGDAEGATAKFKAGASSAFSFVEGAAGGLAIGAGAALVGFGIKSVAAFQDTALAAGKFSEASGIAVGDASKLQEVARDLGVNTDSLAGSMARFQKAVASNSGAVKELGLETIRTKDGQVDVNATFVEAIRKLGGVEDANKKAALASQLFGRGFADSAELILGNADDIQKRLDSVSKAQIISPEDVQRAKEFRDSLDNLQDSLKGVELTVGRVAVPVLGDLADELNAVTQDAEKAGAAIDKIPGGSKVLGFLKSGLETAINPTKLFTDAVDGLRTKVTLLPQQIDRAQDSILHITTAAELAADAAGDTGARWEASTIPLEAASGAFADLGVSAEGAAASTKGAEDAAAAVAAEDARAADAAKAHADALQAVADAMDAQRSAALELVGGDIGVREAQRKAKQAVEDLNTTLDDQTTTLGQAGAAIDDAAQSQLDAAQAAADYRAKQMEANGEQVNSQTKAQLFKEELQKLQGQLSGPLAAAIQNYLNQLAAIPQTIGTQIVLSTPGRVGDTVVRAANSRVSAHGATGGIVNRPTVALIGEAGPEAVIPLSQTAGNGPLPGMGGNTYHFNITVQQPLTPQQVVTMSKKFARFNGES